mmetsp:Transcript_10877/g.30026  ORF Transcript_10877/g.30026 Transcript_10877/m.30026 type:complete len:251 (+) Transcript_10877:904-1656(+)
MGSGDEVQSIDVGELFCDVLPKGVSSSAGGDTPTASVIGIGPNEIAHGSLVRHLLDTVEVAGVIEGVDGWGEASVQAEYTIGNDGSHWQVIKGVREVLPNVGVSVLSEAFVVESVHLRDLTTLVVASQDCDAVSVPHFERHEQRDCLQRVVSSVDVVTHEQIVRLRTRTPDAEEFRQIIKLPMNVSAHGHWRCHLLDVGLFLQDLFGLLAQIPHFVLWERVALSQSLDLLIELGDRHGGCSAFLRRLGCV